MQTEEKLPSNTEAGICVGLLAFIIGFLAVSWLLWQIPIPHKLGYYWEHLSGWLAMYLSQYLHFFPERGNAYRWYLQHPPAGINPLMFTFRFNLSAFVALILAIYAGFKAGEGPSAIKHIAGRQLFTGKKALVLLTKRATFLCQKFGVGLRLHSTFPWQLSIEQEKKHFLVWGATGGGKTQIITPMIQAAIARKDKLIIFDNKGDFTEWLPYFVLLAPWDSRSATWDIAKDCQNAQDARELAARLIVEGNDPIWHQSARQVLAAVIIKLQKDSPGTWTWRSLYELACSSQEELLVMVRDNVPEARHLFETPGKTTLSVLINLGANLGLVGELADAWGDADQKRRFSFAEWLSNDQDKRRIVVLQGSGRYQALAQSYIQSVISLVSNRINSPGFSESKTRRLWFFLDEFPQMGQLKNFAALLEIGRSKGVRVVLGAQDIAQIKQLYGENVTNSWISMVGTQIVVRLNPGSTANDLAKEVIGTRTIDRWGFHKGEIESPRREQPLVVEPSVISQDLGPTSTGVRALILGFADVFMLDWPFSTTQKKRPAVIEAKWLNKTSVSDSEGNSLQVQKPPAAGPRLKLRQPNSSELACMAETGTTLGNAAEDAAELVTDFRGGHDESE